MVNSVVPVLPQDIIDCIIEAIGFDMHLLKTCALVSSSFLLPSRKRLFSHIDLQDSEACRRLYQVLSNNSVIRSLVRSITIKTDDVWQRFFNPYLELNSASLIAILQLPYRYLERFSIYFAGRSGLKSFSAELQVALSTILRSASLKIVTLHNAAIHVPIELFQGIHPSYLQFNYLSLNNLDSEQSNLLASTVLDGTRTTTSDPVIDCCVWNYFGQVHSRTEPQFLPFMCHLRVFEICAHPCSASMRDFNILSFVIRSLRASLTSPATLEHLKVNIIFVARKRRFSYRALLNDLRDDDVWRHLDSIITDPTGSRLQKVDINIEYRYVGMAPDEAEVEQVIRRALPLLREKGILSVKGEVSELYGEVEGVEAYDVA